MNAAFTAVCVCMAMFTATYGKQLLGKSYCVNMSPGARRTVMTSGGRIFRAL